MSDFFAIPKLHCIDDDEESGMMSSAVGGLQPIHLGFFVPRLDDKPQNPIMDTLRRAQSTPFSSLPSEIIDIAASELVTLPPVVPPPSDSIWVDALTHNAGFQSQVLSWDNLHPRQKKDARRTPFLSEQDSRTFAAARHHLQPRLHDPNIQTIHVTLDYLWLNLSMTICGTASRIHTWDAKSERFVLLGAKDGREGNLLVDGKDDVISASVLRPFLRIGNLLRRLENVLTGLRARNAQDGPTVHAFAHSLSTTLTFLRDSLARSPLAHQRQRDRLLTKLTAQYDYYEVILIALADLCGVSDWKPPSQYEVLPSAPQSLLTRIYDTLNAHIDGQAPKYVRAVLAYLLTGTSSEYFNQVSSSVGFGDPPLLKVAENDFENAVGGATILDAIEATAEDIFPEFFPDELVDALPAARKSLILLRAAQANHPILTKQTAHGAVTWFWQEQEIHDERPEPKRNTSHAPRKEIISEDPFAIFEVFNMTPGMHMGPSSFDQESNATSRHVLEEFIETFPDKLPLKTPTLPHLTSLVLKPLLDHASTLSSALLSLFLSPSTQLNLHTHMKLLQSYLLLASPEFKSRLNHALFSDHEDTDYDEQVRNPMSMYALRHRRGPPARQTITIWAVGLAPTLLDRDAWPPVGADLSFFLRTVIVDTFRAVVGSKLEDGALEDLDNRLGFAIRDLPVGRGRDRWLSPLSTEALDFLYMDYKPPKALEVLITPENLAKYHRMFSFLLRLTRVENAVAAVFRMTRPSGTLLFPTFSQSRKLLLHFRFITSSLVSALSQYTFVTAIGGNFDTFLARLEPDAPPVLCDGRPSGFADVFGLARAHSQLLDDILSACVMRSTQRQVGDMLRDVLEYVLEFCIFVGKLQRKQMEEYDAAPILEEMYIIFRKKVASLIKGMRALVDKHAAPSSMTAPHREGQRCLRRPPGGVQALSHLLLQWDANDWWASHAHRSTDM